MKKIILFLLICSFQSIGQEKRIKFGVMGGPILSRVTYPYLQLNKQTHIKTSYSIGIIAETRLYKNILFQPVLNFVNKGGKENSTINNNFGIRYGALGSNICYFEVPLNMMYVIKDRLKIGVGPYFAYLIKGKFITEQFKVGGPFNNKQLDKGLNFQTQILVINKIEVLLNYNKTFFSPNTPINEVLAVQVLKFF